MAFVRATAAAWRLGHAQEDGGGGGGGGGGGEGKGVRVWLPPVRLNSTHDVAAGMSVAPESAVGDDGGGEGAGGAAGQGGGGSEGEGEGFDAGEFTCRVWYAMLPSGVLTVESDVSMPEHWPNIPRCVVCGVFWPGPRSCGVVWELSEMLPSRKVRGKSDNAFVSLGGALAHSHVWCRTLLRFLVRDHKRWLHVLQSKQLLFFAKIISFCWSAPTELRL